MFEQLCYRSIPSRTVRFGIIGLLTVLLTACTTQKDVYEAEQPPLVDVTNWVAQGKMSYALNDERGSFSFRWIQTQQEFEIVLFGPLGISVAKISGNETSAAIETSNGQRLTALGPEQLLRQTLGLDMPVSAMIYWLRGIPQDISGADYVPVALNGNARSGFNESGWLIELLRVDQDMNPNRIRFSKPGAKLLVIVKEWSY